jgi:hypothetical protein
LPQDLYVELLTRLSSLRNKRESVELWAGVASGLTCVLLVALLALVIEAVLHLSITGRTILFWSSLALASGGLMGFIAAPLALRLGIRKRASYDELAKAVGDHFPTISDRLLNTLQLARPLFSSESALIGSPSFALAAFNATYGEARTVDFNAIVDERPLKRTLVIFLVALATTLGIFFAFHSEMFAAGGRLVHFRTFYQKPAPFVLHVEPGNTHVMRGDTVSITITTSGEQLQRVKLHIREEGQKDFDAISLDKVNATDPKVTTFRYELRAQRPLEYYAEQREIESDHFRIALLDHPIIRSLIVTIKPPSYTREKPIKLDENLGDISGVAGTQGEFRAITSKPLRAAFLTFTPNAHINQANDTIAKKRVVQTPKTFALQVSDTIANGSVTFMESGSYHIDLLDQDSIMSEHPIEYNVTITRDEPPTIALIEPNDRADIPSNMRIQMLAKVHDDFGFRGVRLGYRLVKSKYLPEEKTYAWLDVPLSNHNTQDLDVPYIWNTTKLSLSPEDEIGFVLEVADNDAVTGPKTARTSEFIARFPSVKEIFEHAEEQANRAEKDLKEIKQDATELKKKIDEAMNEMQQTKSSEIARQQQDFTKQKDAQQILQRQQELNKRVEQVSKDLEQMTKQLDQQQALSPETMQKYQDLQKLFEQINSPELKKAMEKLQEAMKQVDPKKVQEAMKNMQLNEENFKKSIERTTNILKKIQAEQKVDELTKRSGELAKQEEKAAENQENAAEHPESQSPQDKAAAERQQEDAKKELERMQKEAQDLAAQMKKLPEQMQAPEEMKAVQEALNDPSTEQSMDDAEKAAKQGDHARSKQRAQDAAKKMKQAQKKLRDLKQKLSENEKQRTLRELKQIRDELNRLSKAEENIKNQSQQAAQNSNVFRDLAEQQADKKDQLGQTASRALDLAQKSMAVPPEMGKAMGEAFAQMQKAEDAMTERDQSGASQNSQGAMASLNKAAQQAQQSMDAMNSGGQDPGEGEGEGDGQPGGDNPGSEGEGKGKGQGKGQGAGSAMQQFLNSINKLAAQQQALNDQMSGGQGSGSAQAQRQAMEQQAQLSKMAAKQQAVQKSIEELAQEQQNSRDGDRKAAENLKKISDDMQDVISQMRSSGVSPETIQRQERILSRLLEAQRSVHQRDKEETRESKPGDNQTRESPRELDLSTPEGRQQMQQELQRMRESGYSRDYNTLIRKYFESLEKARQQAQ